MSEHSLIYASCVKRATPLPADERRRALIAATLPLLREHGMAVSTRQIAEAAGVAEGTIFRVFDSKDDLIHAALGEAFSVDGLTDQLAACGRDNLQETVATLLDHLISHFSELRSLMSLAHRGGLPHPPGHGSTQDDSCRRPDPAEARTRIDEAVTSTLTPFATHLSTTPVDAGQLVVAVAFGYSIRRTGSAPSPDSAHLARLLLAGLTQEA